MRTLLVPALLLATAALALADGGGTVTEPKLPAAAKPVATAESRYNEGEALARKQAWSEAEAAYRKATAMRADFPEAWNGLGHALKMQRKFPDALKAYERALDLRPSYPQALEYLGETYVAMNRMDEARATLAKLEPLDPKLADKLEQAIIGGATAGGW
jgi:tetratricopeptide (TPR) repeat protein